MGLLDKLFGGNSSELIDKFKDFVETGSKEETNESTSVDSPFGISWGERMPQEENQYNSGKSYDQYFYDILTENFPTYRITCEKIFKYNEGAKITFYNGEIKELVIELQSENDSDIMIHRRCELEGIPYLRFYYDHKGWWNTKKYVLNRTRNALGMSIQY